jgi:ribonuclease P/MRP protein subunit RPP1
MPYADIVFPQDNESDFVEKAKELGISKLTFVYNYQTDFAKVKKKLKDLELPIKIGVLVPYNLTRKQMDKLKGMTKFYRSQMTHMRHVIEKKLANVVFDIEDVGKKEYMHHRNSGMNQVIAKLMKKNKITWGVSFSTLLGALRDNRIKLLGRIVQNIKIQDKYKFNGVFASFAKIPAEMRAIKDLQSVLVALGMNEKLAKAMMLKV